MGNREDLLSSAKRCLLEKGYMSTTARDIATGAGVSLAAIGYHFGSKDRLMNEAVYAAIGEWGEEFEQIARKVGPTASPAARLEALWTHMTESFIEHRPLWASQVEIVMLSERRPELREFFASVLPMAWPGLGQEFQGIDQEAEPERATLVGKLYHAIMIGTMTQWLVRPDLAPTGSDLVAALRMVADFLEGDTGNASAPPR